jgi:phenylpropionate dioxygenase-like ring-hydroxylating dioxygenase large terminal subunit
MERTEQIAEGRKLLAHIAQRTTSLADEVYRLNVSDYTCSKQAALEQDAFFRRGPINVGLSCLLPHPGDSLTHDWTGVPILLVRQADGSLEAFLNVCRHRGARIAEGTGAGAQTFSCPYHGWTYGLDGRLVSRPGERAFGACEKDASALRALPVAERHGLIWVCPTPGGTIDLDGALDGLGVDLAGYRLEQYHHYQTRVLRKPINWKVAVDTFLEAYHIGVLHAETLGSILYPNIFSFRPFGKNLRLIGPRRSIDTMRAQPEHEWDLITHSVVISILFPNTVFIMQGDHVETWHMFPAGNGTDESAMYISLYTPEPARTDSARRHWDRNMDLAIAVVEKEDFVVGAGIQRGFYSGAQDHIVFGRNEPGLQHYHRAIKRALGMAETA